MKKKKKQSKPYRDPDTHTHIHTYTQSDKARTSNNVHHALNKYQRQRRILSFSLFPYPSRDSVVNSTTSTRPLGAGARARNARRCQGGSAMLTRTACVCERARGTRENYNYKITHERTNARGEAATHTHTYTHTHSHCSRYGLSRFLMIAST